MVSEAVGHVRVLVHGERAGELEPIEALLGEIGAGVVEATSADHLVRLLDGDEIDLALADAGWEVAQLEDLLRALEGRRGGAEVPIILLAHPGELSEWVQRSSRRFHVALLDKPAGRERLASALRSGLALRAHRRGHDDLLAELRRANAELDRRRREAEAETRRRIWLMAAISHHLRTPVHEVALSAQLLRTAGSAPDPADWEALNDGLRDGVDWLRELVEDLVDIAQLDLGTMAFREVAFPICPFLERTLETHRRDAARGGLEFVVTLNSHGAVARTDPEKLARILRNLTSNAVKFTDTGGVTVAVRAEAGRGLVVDVSDTGPGIAADKLEGIFDEFAQLSNPARDRSKGTGLGLALCRRLVGALRGHLHVRSELGRGSTFTVTLPCEVVTDAWSVPEDGPDAPS